MKTKKLSRRSFINNTALSALAVCLFGCTKTVTRYRPDGTPYTEDVEDPLATLAAVVLLLIIIGAYAASKRNNEDDGYSLNERGDWKYFPNGKNKIWPANMVSENNIEGYGTEKISITDLNGKILAAANGYASVNKDLTSIKSLLNSENISNLQKPLVICLKQDKLDVYQIKNIKHLDKSSKGQCRIVERSIDGQSYKIKVFSCSDNAVKIEIEPPVLVNQNVA